jgi:hypothetical protein
MCDGNYHAQPAHCSWPESSAVALRDHRRYRSAHRGFDLADHLRQLPRPAGANRSGRSVRQWQEVRRWSGQAGGMVT